MTDLLNYAELSTTCSCIMFDPDTMEETPSDYCFGDCFDSEFDFFTDEVDGLLSISTEWEIEGFPTWRGPVGGQFTATTARELLDAITPSRSEWTLRYQVADDHLVAILYHHDAPTGGRMIVRPILVED